MGGSPMDELNWCWVSTWYPILRRPHHHDTQDMNILVLYQYECKIIKYINIPNQLCVLDPILVSIHITYVYLLLLLLTSKLFMGLFLSCLVHGCHENRTNQPGLLAQLWRGCSST